jgi:cell wall-associated NlpC family hydrolase
MKLIRLCLFCLLFLFALSSLAFAQAIYKVGDKHPQIAATQKALLASGFKIDRTDGLLSKKTSKAIKAFQKKQGWKPTGRLDEKTYKAITAPPEKATLPAGKGGELVKTASQYRGVPYKFGGVDVNGFDCSGYTYFVFQKHNITLPRTADVQFNAGLPVQQKDLLPGDLVFFETDEKGPSHVGIYAGGGKFWHASSSRGVMLSGLSETYWKARYLGSRRILKK